MSNENLYTKGFQDWLIDQYLDEIDEQIDSEPVGDY